MKRYLTAIAALFILILSPGPSSANPIIALGLPATDVQLGTVFDVFVSVDDAQDLYAFQFDISFDPTILQATAVTEGAFLSQGGLTTFMAGFIDNTLGFVSLTAGTLQDAVPGVTGAGILAGFQFLAASSGTSPIAIENWIGLDSSLTDVPAPVLQGGAVSVREASSTVPEPSTMLLLGSGLLGLVGLNRRRKA